MKLVGGDGSSRVYIVSFIYVTGIDTGKLMFVVPTVVQQASLSRAIELWQSEE